MFQVVQPMQTVTVDGQEALFIPNMNTSANQLNGAQPIQIGNQQAFITPNGQIIRAPGNILQNMGQTVSLPTGEFIHFFFKEKVFPLNLIEIKSFVELVFCI